MRRHFSTLVFLALLPLGAAAQQRSLEQVRDSLGRVSSVAELRKGVAALGRIQTARSGYALMERGLILLRLYELDGQNRDGDEARKSFERWIEREPRSGLAHYALGLALAGGPGVRVPTPGGVLDGFVLGQSLAEIVKQDPRSRAGRYFLRALELDPSLAPAAVQLATLALDSRDRELLRRSEQALRELSGAGAARPEVTAILARVQSALGDVAAAEATAANASDGLSGSNMLLARAEALLRQPGKADAGARAYFEGIEQADAAALVAYFNDLRIVASERELAGWEGGSLDSRRAWLRSFWDARAATSGKTVADRLGEHYRRLAHAQERFRRTGKRGGAPLGSLLQLKYDAEQLPFDERGIIYVRHGEPERVVRTSNVDLRPNESWSYTRPDGKRELFHFVVLRDGTDYRLVDDILQAMDPSTQELPYEGVISLLQDRAEFDARYNVLATRFNSIRNSRWGASAMAGLTDPSNIGSMMEGASGMLQNIAQTRLAIANENREAAYRALASDSDRPVFASPLPFYYDVYTFKGSAQETDVTAAVAVPGSSLEPRSVNGAVVYSLQLSLIVIDTLTGRVSRRDTVFHLRAAQRLGQDEHLRLHTQVSAPASRSTIHRLVIHDLARPGHGQLYGGDTSVPAYDATSLMISDIVLAEPERGAWHRGDADLALVPPRQFMEGRPLTLFYELYNLAEGSQYQTEITLTPAAQQGGFGRLKRFFGANDGTVRLRFDGAARAGSGGYVQEIRQVTTAMKPGRYRVQIRVTNLANQQTTLATKEFVVIDQK